MWDWEGDIPRNPRLVPRVLAHTMRGAPLFLIIAASQLACDPTGVEEVETVELTLRIRLAGERNVGATPGRVYVYTDSQPVPRAFAFPEWAAGVCVLARTPVTTCIVNVPRYGHVSLIAAEPDPAVFVTFAPKSPQDTVRDGRYVEFTGWTECPDRAERGLCVIRPSNSLTIEGNFQLMQQVTIYQTGAARMEYRMFSAGPTLKVPAENDNILDYAGCRRFVENPWAIYDAPCDSVRMVGDSPYHRFTAYVPRQTIVGMFPLAGLETEYESWQGGCILSGSYWPGVCSLISPDTAGAPIILTARFTWWDCAAGPADRDTGGCVLRGQTQSAKRDDQGREQGAKRKGV